MLGFEISHFVTAREQALMNAEVTASNLARSLSQHAQDTFEMADLALSGMTEALIVDEPFAPNKVQRLHEAMIVEVAVSPRMRELAVYDEDGNWITSSLPVLPTRTNDADQAYFKHHRDSVSSASFVGPPVRSRSTGEWIITVTRRLDKVDGSFGGVVLAGISAHYFVGFYNDFDVGREGTIGLLSPEGTLYARVPYNDNIVGSSLASSALYVDHLSRAPSGGYRYSSPIDGVKRVGGHKLGDRFPIIVSVALGQNEVLGSWRQDVFVRGTSITILVLLVGFMGFRLAEQVARRREVEADLARMAATDALTGLSNRRAFDEALTREWKRAAREGRPLSLVLIDVDRFKPFNDRYGHQAGDFALQAIANACRNAASRPGDLAARYGGEELALILPNTDAAGSAEVAERARRAVEVLGLQHDGNEPSAVVTVSLGCATLRPPRSNSQIDAAGLIRIADHALYEAKIKGRNRVIVAGALTTVIAAEA
jgi:diguanylate cyclase (GGDEF)-like protein